MAKVGARKTRCIKNMGDNETDLSVALKEFGEKVSEAMIPVAKYGLKSASKPNSEPLCS